jgi:hypothetical protein
MQGGKVMREWYEELRSGIALVAVLLCALYLGTGCNGPGGFDYLVQVQDRVTGDYVQDAKVTIQVPGKVPLDDTTDVNGIVAIVVDSSYAGRRGKLIIEASGYKRYEQHINLAPGALPDVVQLEQELPTTSTKMPTPAPTFTPTPAPTFTPTPTPTPTATLTPTPTVGTPATALRGAGIFAAPDADSQVRGGVSEGEQVTVLGCSAVGEWFYIRDDQGVEGFVYAPWFEWTGDYESLPVKAAPPSPDDSEPTPGSTPPALEMKLWYLSNGWCSGPTWYRHVYIEGRGGDGTYTYYWNGEKVAGPTSESHTFEVHSVGGAIIGTGKVVSGDGQEVERELYIPAIDC